MFHDITTWIDVKNHCHNVIMFLVAGPLEVFNPKLGKKNRITFLIQ